MREIKAVLVHNYFNPFKDPMSILSFLIRVIANTYYNHCEVLIEENGEKYLIGAVYPKVRKISYDKWISKMPRDFKIIDLKSSKSQDEMITYAKNQIGKRYDFISLLFLIPCMLIVRKLLKASRNIYCYELAANTAGDKESYFILPNEFIEAHDPSKLFK